MLQLKHQRTSKMRLPEQVIEIPQILGDCCGLIYSEKQVFTEAKFPRPRKEIMHLGPFCI